MHEKVKEEYLFLPLNIRELPNLEGIVKINFVLYKTTKWEDKNFEKRQNAFEIVDGLEF